MLAALGPGVATLVGDCPLPALLVGLPSGEIHVANDAASSLLGPDGGSGSSSTLVGQRLADVLGEPPSLAAMLAMLAAGQLESFCQRQRRVGEHTTRTSVHVTVTATPAPADDHPRQAIVVAQHTPDRVSDGMPPVGTTNDVGHLIGILDREWRLAQLSASARALLGDESLNDDRALMAHLHPGDGAKLLMAVATLATGTRQSSLTARLRAAGGRWMTCRVIIAALDTEPPPAFAFIASPARSRSTLDRSYDRRLSECLRRIAILASLVDLGHREDDAHVAGLPLSRLTSREGEIVLMLLAGDTVSTIAAGLVISPSTVRNHLAASFRKLGVRSQRELLRRAREFSPP